MIAGRNLAAVDFPPWGVGRCVHIRLVRGESSRCLAGWRPQQAATMLVKLKTRRDRRESTLEDACSGGLRTGVKRRATACHAPAPVRPCPWRARLQAAVASAPGSGQPGRGGGSTPIDATVVVEDAPVHARGAAAAAPALRASIAALRNEELKLHEVHTKGVHHVELEQARGIVETH